MKRTVERRASIRFEDGNVVVSEESVTQISPRVLDRHRKLALLQSQPLEKMLLEEYDGEWDALVEEGALEVAHPVWEKWSDLHFAQVLFQTSIAGYISPWSDDGFCDDIALTKSEKSFVSEVMAWALPQESDPEPMRTEMLSVVDEWIGAAHAALALDAAKLLEITKPIVQKWDKRWG